MARKNFKNVELKQEDIHFDSMIFYKSWVEVLKALPVEQRDEAIIAICNYSFDGIIPESFSSPMIKMFFDMAKPLAEANIKSKISSKHALEERWSKNKNNNSKTSRNAKPKEKESKDNNSKEKKEDPEEYNQDKEETAEVDQNDATKEEKEEPHEKTQEEKTKEIAKPETAEEAFRRRQKEILAQPGFAELRDSVRKKATAEWERMKARGEAPTDTEKFIWIQNEVDDALLAAGYFIE